MNDLWVLFESGHLSKVHVTLYKAPAERSRLLDAYVTTECEGAVTRSARRAADAVLNWLPPEYRPKEPMVASFDLSGYPVEQSLTGESCGLAFAIGLASTLIGRDPGSLAATGILGDSSAQTEVKAVRGVYSKIKGAIQTLPPNSRVFFPDANKEDIDSEIEGLALKKQIVLDSISSLDQALCCLFEINNRQPRTNRHNQRRSVALWVCLLLSVASLAGFLTLRGNHSLPYAAPDSPLKKESVQQVEDAAPMEHVAGAVTLMVTSSIEKIMAPSMAVKLSRHLDPSDTVTANLTVKRKELSQGAEMIEATLTNVSLQRNGATEFFEVKPANVDANGDLTNTNDQLLDLLIKNYVEATQKPRSEMLESEKSTEATSKTIIDGKGFD